MRVLVACEESQRVCVAFRERGHEAYSCDILPCSGGHPEWHINDDVLNHLDGWDLIIAHPPCTYLSVCGNRWFNVDKYGENAMLRTIYRLEAYEFFMRLVNAPCERIAIENPIGFPNTHYRKPDQIIRPWMFGESNNKPICLWLKNLPRLKPTEIVPRGAVKKFPCGSTNSVWWAGKSARERSKTFLGIAEAMAKQWG